MTRTIAALLLALLLMTGVPAGARPTSAGQPVFGPDATGPDYVDGATRNADLPALTKAPHLAMELVVDGDALPGSNLRVAIAARPAPGWHGYWQNPGDAGVPTKVRWALPAFWSPAEPELRYPVPDRLLIAGLMNYVYERPFALLTSINVPMQATRGARVPLHVRLDYLVCTTSICVPEAQELATTVKVGNGRSEATGARFAEWQRALPQPLGGTATYSTREGAVRIAIPYPADAALTDAYFYPLRGGAVDYAAPQKVSRDGDRLVIETRGHPTGDVEGVLKIGPERGLRLWARPGDVPAASDWWLAALLAFGGAVLGGLILNVMPCVFPILSLKALSLAKSGDGEGAARREALAYTAGVVLVCVALGGAVLALRAGGSAVGWAFQLQDARVAAVLALLMFGLSLNLAGLFELAMPGAVGRLAVAGSGSAFASGALAAVVATPCSGPFMGAALGAALVLPWAAGLAVFAGLGLGLALPFLLLGFVPSLRRRLPRPGAWMAQFRRLLALPMLATAVWLAWLVGRLGGVDAMALALFAAAGSGVVFWALGRRQAAGQGSGLAWPMLLLIAGLMVATMQPQRAARAETGDEAFSEARLAALRAQGKPVFAYFTADWCLTCKVNERVAIEPSRAALNDKGVAVLVGDWTDGDPTLGRFIEANGRAGVPLYLYYPPGREARVLPQVLTPGMLGSL